MKEPRFRVTYRGNEIYNSHYKINSENFIKANNHFYLGELKFEEMKNEKSTN